jgi:hypothetical protein
MNRLTVGRTGHNTGSNGCREHTMSDTSERKPDEASSDADTAEAKKSEGREPSLQEHHDPGTEADSASGGPAE